jgi:AraC-like DNA-binding protein
MHAQLVRCRHRVHNETCPLGLLCSSVPIFFGDTLVGEAKLVLGPEAPHASLSVAARLLELTVSRFSLALYVLVLTEDVKALKERLDGIQNVRSDGFPGPDVPFPRRATSPSGAQVEGRGSVAHRALAYVSRRYLAPTLSLVEVARALGCNEKYLAHRFSEVVGQHMRAYVVARRLHHACTLLLRTEMLVKQVGLDSGFHDPAQFTRSFHRHLGVCPREYRRIFSRPGL